MALSAPQTRVAEPGGSATPARSNSASAAGAGAEAGATERVYASPAYDGPAPLSTSAAVTGAGVTTAGYEAGSSAAENHPGEGERALEELERKLEETDFALHRAGLAQAKGKVS